MKISCYIPLYNNQDTIAYCLDSVLNQTKRPDDILVVDDASTDDGPRITSKYPVRMIRHEQNLGLAAARNTALNNIQSDLVASVDSDCILSVDWLEILTEALVSAPQAAGAGGRLLETQSSSVFDLWRAAHMKQYWDHNESNPKFLFGSNTLFRYDCLRQVGLYDESLGNNTEDVEICQRLKQKGFALLYQPAASAQHMKKDNIRSLLNSHWNWHRFYYQQGGWFSEKFSGKIAENIGLANRYLEEDLAADRHQLLYLDFLLALHYCFRDMLYVKKHPVVCSPTNVWGALMDLRLSASFGQANNGVFRFDLPETGFSADFLSGCLLLREALHQKFPDKEFSCKVYVHLLESIYGIKDYRLAELIRSFSEMDWNWLLQGTYPLSSADFLAMMKKSVAGWLDMVAFKSGQTPTLIELAERGTF